MLIKLLSHVLIKLNILLIISIDIVPAIGTIHAWAINVIMDVRKLTVIRAQLPWDSLMQVRLNCAENGEIFAEMLQRLDSEIEDDDSHSARKYPQ